MAEEPGLDTSAHPPHDPPDTPHQPDPARNHHKIPLNHPRTHHGNNPVTATDTSRNRSARSPQTLQQRQRLPGPVQRGSQRARAGATRECGAPTPVPERCARPAHHERPTRAPTCSTVPHPRAPPTDNEHESGQRRGPLPAPSSPGICRRQSAEGRFRRCWWPGGGRGRGHHARTGTPGGHGGPAQQPRPTRRRARAAVRVDGEPPVPGGFVRGGQTRTPPDEAVVIDRVQFQHRHDTAICAALRPTPAGAGRSAPSRLRCRRCQQAQCSPRQASRPSLTATAATARATTGSAQDQPNSELSTRPTSSTPDR